MQIQVALFVSPTQTVALVTASYKNKRKCNTLPGTCRCGRGDIMYDISLGLPGSRRADRWVKVDLNTCQAGSAEGTRPHNKVAGTVTVTPLLRRISRYGFNIL